MKWCGKCKVKIRGTQSYCPLCQNELSNLEEQSESLFPTSYRGNKEKHLAMKIITFMMILAGMLSVFINILYPTKIWWGLIVVIILLGARISLGFAIAKHRSILKYLFYQSLLLISIAIFVDLFTGKYGWSITYVLPIIFTLAMITMYLLSKILHLQPNEYMIYLLLDAAFGIIPIIFIVRNSVTTPIPSFVCIMASIISVIALIIFEGNNMYSELKRRLHI